MICGIDNGVTGSIGFTDGHRGFIFKTPVFKDRYYTKKEKFATRVHTEKLKQLMESFKPTEVIIERPMVNPSRFEASISAIRAMEATQICLEQLSIPYRFIDSKEWQKYLPKGDTKEQSLLKAQELYPDIDFKKFKDGDGLLIAHYASLLN